MPFPILERLPAAGALRRTRCPRTWLEIEPRDVARLRGVRLYESDPSASAWPGAEGRAENLASLPESRKSPSCRVLRRRSSGATGGLSVRAVRWPSLLRDAVLPGSALSWRLDDHRPAHARCPGPGCYGMPRAGIHGSH